MRYFLRKYKEKFNQFDPVQLRFENEDGSNLEQKQLESIPELSNETSFEMAIDNSIQQKQISPKYDNCIITRSKLKQSTSKLSSPMVTITNTSKKLIIASNSPCSFNNRQISTRRQTLQKQQRVQQIQQQKDNDLMKLQQNLFNKFNDTESSEDEIKNDNSKQDGESSSCAKTATPQFKSLLSTAASSTSSSDSDDDINKTVKINRGTTPPHKRFRKLRLYDLPQTPKTLIKKSTNINDANKTPTSGRRLYKPEEPDLAVTAVQVPTPKCVNNENTDLKMHLRMRLFDNSVESTNTDQQPPSSIVSNLILEASISKIRSPLPYQAQANINPFTPNHNSTINSASSNNHDLVNENNFVNSQFNSEAFINNHSASAKRNRNDSRSYDENIDIDENGDDCEIPKNKRLALRQCLVSRYHEEFHEVCKLGSGEFGDVFKCINRLDGCTYAIKRSKKPIAGSALEISAWKEVCAHAVLVKHNHIVQYYSAWAEADRMLIQNEYCNGGSLAEFIENNKFNERLMSEADLKTLLLHTAKGLAYMHSLNLVHLDIKPGML